MKAGSSIEYLVRIVVGIGAFLWAGAACFGQERDDPASELASFQIADGFEVNLFASEQEGVVKPIQIRFDARGRLWVIGSTVYPQVQPGHLANDKVLILEDTAGEGRCGKTTVFAEGLMIPTGIELGDGGAYVGQGTELIFLKDNDGDGKADERRVLFRGFGTGDGHQTINSFRWGPGGELWMSQGLHVRSRVETPWGIVHLEHAGLWRLRPRLLRAEGFYGSAHEPQNPWGFVFTRWGEPIVLAGNNSSPIYPVPGLVVNHRDDPPALIWKNGNGRKVSGGEIVATAHFPDAWQGALIMGGYINNAVWTVKINDDGAGFSLEDLPPLIKSSSRSFRPVDVRFGPDGALYICDWYNPIIGHYQASFRHPDRDKTHGRIWRVTAKGRPLTKPPRLADASIPQLFDHLKSPDSWTRHFAKRVLADGPTDGVIPALKGWFENHEQPEGALVEALGVCQSHEAVVPELLARLCGAKESGARAYAASVVGSWADRLTNALDLLRPLAADENPRVRLQAIVACSYVPRAEAMEVAGVAADFGSDKFLDYAFNQVVFALKPYWLGPFQAGNLNLENKSARLSVLIRADGTPDTLEAVRELLKSAQLDSAARETYFRILADTGDGHDLASILELADEPLQSHLLPALETAARVRNLRPSGDLSASLRRLLQSQSIGLRAEALRLAGLWKLEGFRAPVKTAALDTTASEQMRRAAMEALASFGGNVSSNTLRTIDADSPPLVQSGAIAALCSFDVAEAARFASDSLTSLRDEMALTEIFTAFLQRQSGAAALAKTLGTKPPPKIAAEVGLRLLSSSGRRNERLARVLTEAAGFTNQGKTMTSAGVATLADEVHTRGSAESGAEIFRRAELGCIACHAVNGQGGHIGPELSALGSAQPVEFIIGAILDPQKEVKEGYVSISVITKDGEEYQGYQVRETAEELVLRDVLQNKQLRLRRDTIREKKQNGSVMPNGLTDLLTRAEFRDLIRFLSELGKTAPKSEAR